jgi:hypothetical protein
MTVLAVKSGRGDMSEQCPLYAKSADLSPRVIIFMIGASDLRLITGAEARRPRKTPR